MSSGAPNKALADAYLDTDFAVFGPAPHVFRIGKDEAAAAAWMRRLGAASATIATAWNPFSDQRSNAENMGMQGQFRRELDAQGLRYLDAEGRASSGDWPAEPSFCIFDVAEEQADAWMSDYRQNAVVRILANGQCILAWHPGLRETSRR